VASICGGILVAAIVWLAATGQTLALQLTVLEYLAVETLMFTGWKWRAWRASSE
jgi:hypothetical protein